MQRLLRHLPALLLVGVTWGLTPALGKLAMQGGMRPLGVAATNAAIAALILLVVARLRGFAVPTDRAHRRQYVAGGLIGVALAHLFAFTGLQHVPAGLFALLVPLSGLLTVVLFTLSGVERASTRGLAGAALGVVGVALAMAPGAALPDPALLPWAAVMLLTPICYAVANVLSVKFAVRGTPAVAQAAGTLVAAAGSAALLALPLGHLGLPPSPGIAGLLLLQGCSTAIAYLAYFHLLVAAGGVFTSQTAYVVTLCGLGWGFLLFAEVPGWLTLPAALLVFGGVALATLGRANAR